MAGLVMVELEAIDGVLRLQARQLEAAFDGAAVAGFQFQIRQSFQGGGEAEIAARLRQRAV